MKMETKRQEETKLRVKQKNAMLIFSEKKKKLQL